jgi:uncharacterized repeat protein (TIGR03803 family)
MLRSGRLRILGSALLVTATIALPLVSDAPAQGKFKILHKFTDRQDGGNPSSTLVFDSAGNLYGTTVKGGTANEGVVFELMPNASGGWTERTLHQFTGGRDGFIPTAGVILDAAGNVYGTTIEGGVNGTAFKLAPNQDGHWTAKLLHRFCTGDCSDGRSPYASMTFDNAGNLYGTTQYAGPQCCGTVFRLTPTSDGSWTESTLHGFAGKDGSGPYAGVIFDAAGNLYGTI